jgi:hypothetical protein
LLYFSGTVSHFCPWPILDLILLPSFPVQVGLEICMTMPWTGRYLCCHFYSKNPNQKWGKGNKWAVDGSRREMSQLNQSLEENHRLMLTIGLVRPPFFMYAENKKDQTNTWGKWQGLII